MGNEYISNGHSSGRDMNHDAREVNFFIDPSKNPIERFDCELVCFERHRHGWRKSCENNVTSAMITNQNVPYGSIFPSSPKENEIK